jgi:HlyD family secretion protein
LILERKENILVLPEALLQFDKSTDLPYVEVEVGEQKFERRDITIGISDGINVEILDGLTAEDKVKQWNKTEPIKIEKEDAPERGV